ncbi:MAG: hypothetical protein KC422_24425 [Trueperaceae bacterium]|nr:hypothetical protein [Trueperaceae bacterium]
MRKSVVVTVILIGFSLATWILAQGMMQPGMNQGMMGRMGQGMMGGIGMMETYPPDAVPISIEDATALFERYATEFGNGTQIKDVMAFSSNYYAQLVDADGNGIGELLVDRYRGIVTPEPGPNMMWNGRAGMMGFSFSGPTQFDETAAEERANTFLTTYLPGATVKEGQSFSGYYTFDYGHEEIEGMLSVNAFTGEIWPHTWHGAYLRSAMEE